jgi:hypothetical protein
MRLNKIYNKGSVYRHVISHTQNGLRNTSHLLFVASLKSTRKSEEVGTGLETSAAGA